MPNTIVLAAGPNGLGVVRSLHLNKVSCQIITRNENDVTHKSRIPLGKMFIEGSTEEEQHQWLLDVLISQPDNTVIIPTSDWFVTFLTEHTAILRKNCLFIIPDESLSEILIDKAKETAAVKDVIPVPATVQHMSNAESLKAELSLPIIIKPRSHKHNVLGLKNIVVNTNDELTQFFQNFGDKVEHLIAQEIIQGDDHRQWVCNCFFDENSNMVQAFTFNRLRLSPSHYGVTSYARSQLNDEVLALSAKLGRALSYTGPAMIEFKQDSNDEIYKYIEINPRLGMCNYFDTSCGVNNSYTTYLHALGKTLPSVKPMRNDVIFISFYEDLFSRLSDGESLIHIIKEYLNNFLRKPHVYIYYVWWDPYPAIYLATRQLSDITKSIIKKIFDKVKR
jgi:predicted ATP-grasp superfamily ATP-dependent carboligase